MLDNVKTWAQKPFNPDMDVWMWFLFLVVMLTVAALWLQILNHIGVD